MTRRPVDDLLSTVLEHGTGLVVVTGGEPLLHQLQAGWNHMLAHLVYGARWDVEVETNGTQAPTEYSAAAVSRFNVSPKLRSAGDPEEARLVPSAIAALLDTGKAVFKFVCDSADAVQEAATVADRLGIPPHLVWIMPEGIDPDTLNLRLAEIATPAVDAGFNLTTRLHVHAWPDETRGR